MRILFLYTLASAVLLTAADATGTWTGTVTAEGRDFPARLVLKQEGTALTGTAGADANDRHAIGKGVAGENGALRP